MGINEETAELPLDSAGARLRRAREQSGVPRSELARQTRIAERMLAALEEGNYAVLPARTYAIGFARTYARAVGLDGDAIAAEVRRELDGSGALNERPVAPTFEPGDPARVPSRRVAWIAAGGIILLLIGIAVWRSSNQPVSGLPSILPPDAPATPRPVPATAPTPAPQPAGPVVLTAEAPAWVLITAGGKDLLRHEMQPGETFTVPADAIDPRLRTGRPDALAVTIGGQSVPRIADKQTVVANVPITAAALLARTTPVATPSPGPAAMPSPAFTTAAAPASQPRKPHRQRPAASPPAAAPASAAPSPAEPSTATQ